MKVAIYGAGGNGRELAKLAQTMAGDGPLLFVTDDGGEPVDGLEHWSFADLVRRPRPVCISVADPATRRILAERCEGTGLGFVDLRAATAVDYGAQAGVGLVVCDFVFLGVGVRLGAHFHANYYSQVSHDCRIGDYVTFGPGVRCNGGVTIGDGVYVGAGACIRQGVTIGSRAVIGMGAVVIKNVADGETVVGNPARTMGSIAN